MKRLRSLTVALAMSATLVAAPALLTAAAQSGTATTSGTTSGSMMRGASLAGRYNGLAWGVFGPSATRPTMDRTAVMSSLAIQAHPQAKVLGTKWFQNTVIVGFRVAAPITTVFQFHNKQLTDQGFKRVGSANIAAGATDVSERYTRSDDTVALRLINRGSNQYRAEFDLTGVKGDASTNTNPGQAASGAANAVGNAATGTANAVGNAATGAANAVGNAVTGSNGNAGTNNNSNSTAGASGTTGGTPSAPNRVEDPLAKSVSGDLGRLKVTVLPQSGTMAAMKNTAGAFSFMPYPSASKTAVNFTGNEMFLGYFVNASLQDQFNYYDRQFKAQGFTRVDAEASNDAAGAPTKERKAVYKRGNGTVGVTLDEFGGTNGYRLRANFDNLVNSLK